jgi:hypothetical protein
VTLDDLIRQFRDDADDEAVPYLWSDAQLTRYANQSVEEAARRSRLLLDATTAAVCSYSVAENDPWITLHSSVIEIRHGQLRYTDPEDSSITRVYELRRSHAADLDDQCGWRESAGDPCRYIIDMETGKVRFDHIPTRVATFEIEVSRMPLTAMTDGGHVPDFPERYHLDLVQWMLYRAFSRRDADGNDNDAAIEALAKFELVFGPPSSVIDEQWHGNKPDFRKSRTRFF